MSPSDALTYAKRFVGNLPVDDATVIYRLCDDASKKLWMAAPWRWTIGALEAVTLVNDAQDVNLVGIYSDLYYPISAFLNDGADKKDLIISGSLPIVTTVKGEPSQVAYIGGTPNKLRFLPMPTGYSVGSTPLVTAVYKKIHTDITVANYATDGAAGCPDEWFWVYQEIVLLKAFQFAHDPRMGSVAVGSQGVQYSGQYAVVEASITEMRMREKKYLGAMGVEVNG